jgi:hypothetical protein
MPGSKSRKSARSKGPRLHKQVLLPLPNDYVRDQSLARHVALSVVVRTAGADIL